MKPACSLLRMLLGRVGSVRFMRLFRVESCSLRKSSLRARLAAGASAAASATRLLALAATGGAEEAAGAVFSKPW